MTPPSRRQTLQSIGAAVGFGLAGCLTDAPATDEPARDTSTTEPTTTSATETPSKDVHVGIANEADADHEVTLTIAENGTRVHRDTYQVPAHVTSLAQGAGGAVSVPGTYTVTARLADGTEATYEWHLEGALRDLTVVITPAGEFDFEQQARCEPDCEPVSGDGETADLPYVAPGREETFQPGSVTIETAYDERVALTLEITHEDTTVLRKTYDLPPDRQVSIDRVTATAGTFEVRAATDQGRETAYTWTVPADDNYPHLYVRVGTDGVPIVGCGGPGQTSVSVESSDDAARSVSLSLERDGASVASETVSVPAGGDRKVTLGYPVGDSYRLVGTDGAGHEASQTVSLCYCYSDEATVRVESDGLVIESFRLVCE